MKKNTWFFCGAIVMSGMHTMSDMVASSGMIAQLMMCVVVYLMGLIATTILDNYFTIKGE